MHKTRDASNAYILGDEHSSIESTIESLFVAGKKYYESSVTHPGSRVQSHEKINTLKLAMAFCEHALTHVGTKNERLIKIDILLLMMEIVRYTNPKNKWKPERYFYQAVEIARCCLGEDFLITPHGIKIKEYFYKYINPAWSKMFNNKGHSQLLPLLQLYITNESNKRIGSRMIQAIDTKNYITPIDTPDNILNKLEMAVLGPIRLAIFAPESEEIFVTHHIEMSEAMRLHENAQGIYSTQVEVFHKQKPYRYIIDRGSREHTGQLNKEQIEKVVEPILRIYIERLECMFFIHHADHSACIRNHEENKNTIELGDYSVFINRVLSDATLAGGGMDSVEDYIQSIDIARIFISHSRNKTPTTIDDDIFVEIDKILGGKINRRVYHMVSSILLNRNETMHGTGYPFGLNQKTISLEGKLYMIIRAYEIIRNMYPNSSEKTISTLENWGGGGYLDTRLLSIFVATLDDTSGVLVRERQYPTDYRINRYRSYGEHWKKLITRIDEMQDLYDAFRNIGVNEDLQKILAKRIDENRIEIHRVAGLTNIIILGRHEITESDIKDGGAPGSPHEGLAPMGIANAEVKGHILKQLDPQIYTSPLPRARETAKLICQNINAYIENSAGYSNIQSIKSLTNPPKNREDGQSLSLISKFINFGENQKDLIRLVLEIISSSKQSTNLIITHGDIIRHLMLIIENIFDADKISGVRHPVGHEIVYTRLFQGDRIVPWNLLFSVSDWIMMLGTINNLTESVFGDIFYLKEKKQMSLIKLKDKFLDYIDLKNETNPDNVQEFIQALDADPLTAHFSAILRTEGVIK